MRYQIGNQYPFVKLSFKQKSFRFCSLYLPWEDTDLQIDMKYLTCREHHKVSIEYYEDQQVDGYIFTDNEGRRYTNQYPTAHYGQVDDSEDRRARLESDPFDSVYEDALHRAVSIYTGFTKHLKGDEEKTKMLEAFYKEIVNQIETVSRKKVELKPIIFTTSDGKEHSYPDILKAELV